MVPSLVVIVIEAAETLKGPFYIHRAAKEKEKVIQCNESSAVMLDLAFHINHRHTCHSIACNRHSFGKGR